MHKLDSGSYPKFWEMINDAYYTKSINSLEKVEAYARAETKIDLKFTKIQVSNEITLATANDLAWFLLKYA